MEKHATLLKDKPYIYFLDGKWWVFYEHTLLSFDLPYYARAWAKWLWDYYIPREDDIKKIKDVRMTHA